MNRCCETVLANAEKLIVFILFFDTMKNQKEKIHLNGAVYKTLAQRERKETIKKTLLPFPPPSAYSVL
jgi:hypothetical protein